MHTCRKSTVIICKSQKASNLSECFGNRHLCITLILLSSVSILLSDILCLKYVSGFLKISHLLGFNFSPASFSFLKTALSWTRFELAEGQPDMSPSSSGT